MFTDHLITLEEHSNWVKDLKHNKNQKVFVVLNDNISSGILSFNKIDYLHKKCDFGFYLDESLRGGAGTALEFALIDFVFNSLKFKKINCEVIENNEFVIRLHKRFGFIEEGFRRSNIIKHDKRFGVFLLGMTSNEWQVSRNKIFELNKEKILNFDINFIKSKVK